MVAKTSEPGQVNGRGWRQRGSIGRRGGNNVASCWYRGDRPQPHLVHQGMIVVKLGGRQECSILIGMTRPEGGNLTCTAYQEMRSQEERCQGLGREAGRVPQEDIRVLDAFALWCWTAVLENVCADGPRAALRIWSSLGAPEADERSAEFS